MNAEEIELVLAVIDRKAEEYKQFGSSYRRIMAVRDEVEEELNRQIHPPGKFESIQERVNQTDATRVQEFHKSPERIARMISEAEEVFRHANETESW